MDQLERTPGFVGLLQFIWLTFYDKVVLPFKEMRHATRPVWIISIVFTIDGLIYFGILTLLGNFFPENANIGDVPTGWIIGLFTGGITLTMIIFGGLTDKLGVRLSLLIALGAAFIGRVFLSLSGSFDLGSGLWSPMFYMAIFGLLIIAVAYGFFQPAAYGGMGKFTSKKNSAMGFAVMYGGMNLGAFFSGLLSPPVRRASAGVFPPNGFTGVFWLYTALTLLGLLVVYLFLTKKSIFAAEKTVEEENAQLAKDTDEAIKEETVEVPSDESLLNLTGKQ
ncbi:MFS transporter [Candidatus Kuenenbacteria bacterium]|nr:MFS transporter [Candidatus Kuenenbacteria bacterium]